FLQAMNLVVVVLLSLSVSLGSAILGFDTSEEVSVSQFRCLNNSGYKYYIGPINRPSGLTDPIGIQNIKNANSLASFYNVDAYISPCFGICPTPREQVAAAIKAVAEAKAWYGTLWIDVKDGDWPADQMQNRQDLLDMIDESNLNGGPAVGIYTNMNRWQWVMGDWNGTMKNPLWWANNNAQPNFKNFQPFGGWVKPAQHQYNVFVTDVCSVANINLDWSP
ncbi:hypothetical protein PFISCL1PPCAC_25431, partial [Pristionchus fissidentatus]